MNCFSRVELISAAILLVLIGLDYTGASSIIKTCDFGANRLPDHVMPSHYHLSITPYLELKIFLARAKIDVIFAETGHELKKEKKNLAEKARDGLGRVKQLFFCNKEAADSNPICEFEHKPEMQQVIVDRSNTIVLQADKSLDIHKASIEQIDVIGGEDKVSNQKNLVVEFCQDPARQLIALKFARPFSSGTKARLTIEYSGSIREDMRGIYLSYRREGLRQEEIHNYIVSQFQASDVRFAIPSFDEPHFKATVSLVLVLDKDVDAIASTSVKEVKYKTIRHEDEDVDMKFVFFEESHPITLDLFAFVIGKFGFIEAKSESEIRVRAFTSPGREEEMRFALETAVKALDWMEQYTGVRYPLKKFDLFAVPDHNKGNTENWGLVTVRDVLIQMDEETRQDLKITAAVNVVHVVAHQWFANMVTMEWWPDLWATEGIAAHLAYEMVKEFHPQFPLSPLVRIGLLSSHIQLDSDGKHRPLSPEQVETGQEIYDIYDNFEFTKGDSLMNMLSDYIGKDDFRTGVSIFVSTHKFSTATGEELVDILESAAGKPLKHIVSPWVKLTSHPMINVDLKDNHVALYQEPYSLSSPSVDVSVKRSFETLWTVPVSVLFSDGAGVSTVVEGVVQPENSETVIEAPQWFHPTQEGHWFKVNPNADFSTFYRVRYSDSLLESLHPAIESKQMSPIDRLNVLDDATYLVQGSKMTVERFQKLLTWYADEEDGGVLIGLLIASKVKSAQKVVYQGAADQKNPFMEVFKRSGFAATTSGDDTILEDRARQVVLKTLIDLGVEPVIDAALEAFETAQGDVAVPLRVPVYAAVAKRGNAEQKNKLIDKLKRTRSYDEQLRAATALALMNDYKRLTVVFEWMDQSNFTPEVRLSILNIMNTTEMGKHVINSNPVRVSMWQRAPKPAIPTA